MDHGFRAPSQALAARVRLPRLDLPGLCAREFWESRKRQSFVGDQLDTDYRGAEDAGIRSLLILREKARAIPNGTRTMTGLQEIFNHL